MYIYSPRSSTRPYKDELHDKIHVIAHGISKSRVDYKILYDAPTSPSSSLHPSVKICVCICIQARANSEAKTRRIGRGRKRARAQSLIIHELSIPCTQRAPASSTVSSLLQLVYTKVSPPANCPGYLACVYSWLKDEDNKR